MCNYPYAQLVVPASFAECFTYETQIAWLKKQIDDIAAGGKGDTLEELEKKVEQLERTVNQLSKDVADIDLTTINNDISEIKNSLTQLNNKFDDYAKKSDLTDFVTSETLNSKLSDYETSTHAEQTFAKKTDLTEYVTDTDVNEKLTDYAKKSDLTGFVTSEVLNNYVTSTTAEETYAKKTDIPDVSGLATKTELNEYAKKSEIPDVSNLATKAELEDYVTKASADEEYVLQASYDADMMNIYTKTQADDNFYSKTEADAKFQQKGEAPGDVLTKEEADKLYAKITDIPDVSGYATKTEVTEGLNEKVSVNTFDSTVSTLATKEELTDYAKKSEIPDLTEYVTETDLSTTLEEYATKSEIPDAVTVDDTVSADGKNPVTSKGIYDFVIAQTSDLIDTEMLATKQDKLTFDNAPTAASANPVTSGGVYTAIENATNDKLTITAASETYATKAQLDEKQDKLVFDNAPTEGSENPVTSGGVYSALQSAGGVDTTLQDIHSLSFKCSVAKVEGGYDEPGTTGKIAKYMLDQNFGYGIAIFDMADGTVAAGAEYEVSCYHRGNTVGYDIVSAFLCNSNSYVQLTEKSRANIVNNQQRVIFTQYTEQSYTNAKVIVIFNFCNMTFS